MGMFDKFNLRDNPFRMVPASEPDKLIWAGFPAIKKELRPVRVDFTHESVNYY